MSDDKKIMKPNLPGDLQGIYRLMGYEDPYNYDDEEFKDEYAEALEELKNVINN